MFKAKVTNCGNYKCEHCSDSGRCNLLSISIGKDGKCNQYLDEKPLFPRKDDTDFYPDNAC